MLLENTQAFENRKTLTHWGIVGKKSSEEIVGERDSFLHTRRDADCEARLQLGVETDCLVGNSQEGANEVTKACFTLRPGCNTR